MNRRELLKTILAASAVGAGAVTTQLFAAPTNQNRFLLVFLRGGYDACHLLVPSSSDFYYESRPNIAIAKPSDQADSGLMLNADWSLHPALRETLYPLYQSGELAWVPFAGTEDTSRSHFETQDSIELGQPLGRSRNYQSGFLNRLAGVLNQDRNAIAGMSYTSQLPLIMQGDAQIANLSMNNVNKSNVDQRQSKIIEQMYSQTALSDKVSEGFTVRQEVAQEMQDEANTGSRNAISSKGFELEASRIAKMMRDKYALGFVDIGGWDTHVNQGGAKGALAGKLDDLARGLIAYRNGMGDAWANTTVVVMSEFGRTFRENGKRGTDHGHGSVYWVLGGKVQGGRVAGEQVRVDQAHLFQNRDFPVLNEYRAVLGGLFNRLYGLNSNQLAQVFPQVKARDLALL